MSKNILVTGVDGFLGGKIISELLGKSEYNVIGLAFEMNRVKVMMERESLRESERLMFMTNDQFLSSDECLDIYGAVHLAFSRRIQPSEKIASSVVFATDIFHKLAVCGVDHVINMSTQGVYGNTEEIRTETTPPAPATHYTMAKYATEVLFNDILRDCKHHTNFRLDPVAQSQNVLKVMCKSALNGKISLKGGKQVFSFIDVNDVPTALLAMLKADGDWDEVYNVGWNRRRYTLIELAGLVANIVEKRGYRKPEIELVDDEVKLWAGMDSTRFMTKTGWKPQIELEESIKSIIGG